MRGLLRTLRRLGAAASAAVVALSLGAGAVSAHALLLRSDPVDGSTLGSAPGELRLVFGEPVAVDLGDVSLVDGSGRVFTGVSVAPDPADPATIVVRVPPLGAGAYRLAWRVVDDEDLHVTAGTLVFGIGTAAPPAEAATAPGPAPAETFARWLATLGFAALTGAMLFLVLLVRPAAPGAPTGAGLPTDGGELARSSTRAAGTGGADPDGDSTAIRGRLRRLAAAGAGLALAAGTLLLALQLGSIGGSPAHVLSVLGTDYGIAWARSSALLAVAVALVVAGARRERGAAHGTGTAHGAGAALRLDRAIVVLCAALAVSQAMTGHVGIGPDPRPVRVVALAVHLAAVWAWVGGLVALVVAVLPAVRRGGTKSVVAAGIARGFWRVATPALAALAVTGLYLAGQLVASLDALLETLYGQALLAKLAFGLAAAALGLANAAALHPGLRARLIPASVARRAARRFGGRAVALEAAAALAVVVGAAVMASTPPARGPQFDPPPVAVAPQDVVTRAGDLVVTLAVRPNRPGPNFVELGVYDTRRPSPAPIGGVFLETASPSGVASRLVPARPLTPGRYEVAIDDVAAPGPWRFAVVVRRAGLPDSRAVTAWSVDPAAPPVADRDPLVSNQPLAPVLSPLAAVLGILVAAAAAGAWLGRRRPRSARPIRPHAAAVVDR